MAEEKYPVDACLHLFKLFAEEHSLDNTPAGLDRLSEEDYIHLYDEKYVKGKYLKNRFYDLKKASKEGESSIKVNKLYFDVIAKKLRYDNMDDFLSRNNFKREIKIPDPKVNHSQLYDRNPVEGTEWIDKYVLGARVLPALLGVMPVLIIIYIALIRPGEVSWVIFPLSFFLCLIIAWGLSGWLATIGKKWESKLFFQGGNKGFATAYMMLYDIRSKYNEEQKVQYRQKVERYFDITFPSKDAESEDDTEALRKLHNAAFKIKNVVKSVIIRSALIRYGFLRNLIPSAILSLSLCLPGLAYAWWEADLVLILLLSLYAFGSAYYIIVYDKPIRRASEAYGRYLIDEFLSR